MLNGHFPRQPRVLLFFSTIVPSLPRLDEWAERLQSYYARQVEYEFGSFRKLLKHTKESQHGHFVAGNKSIIVADNAWMNFGTEFEKIVKDIEDTGFDVSIMLI